MAEYRDQVGDLTNERPVQATEVRASDGRLHVVLTAPDAEGNWDFVRSLGGTTIINKSTPLNAVVIPVGSNVSSSIINIVGADKFTVAMETTGKVNVQIRARYSATSGWITVWSNTFEVNCLVDLEFMVDNIQILVYNAHTAPVTFTANLNARTSS